MRNRIGLIDIDSEIPNFALMKLSAYHKSKGDNVEWWRGISFHSKYDKVYASKIFTFTQMAYIDGNYIDIDDLPKDVEIGGSGYYINKKLPDDVEDFIPDYSIYPNCDYSIGFITRGCIRNCDYCIVPEKEGKIRQNSTVENIWRGKGNLVLLDNNILAKPEAFKEVILFCKKNKIKVDFNQGLDCRLITDGLAKFINQYRSVIKPELRFAFDNLDYKNAVEKTCQLIKGRCFWYVYLDENWESALERLLILKRLRQRSYIMRNRRVVGRSFKKFTILSYWSNCMGAMNKMDFYDCVHYYKDRSYFSKV